MYKMKKNVINKIKKYGTVRKLSQTTGYCESYISQVLNRERTVPKKAAYIITKMISNELEINDVFELKKNLKNF